MIQLAWGCELISDPKPSRSLSHTKKDYYQFLPHLTWVHEKDGHKIWVWSQVLKSRRFMLHVYIKCKPHPWRLWLPWNLPASVVVPYDVWILFSNLLRQSKVAWIMTAWRKRDERQRISHDKNCFERSFLLNIATEIFSKFQDINSDILHQPLYRGWIVSPIRENKHISCSILTWITFNLMSSLRVLLYKLN